jgi:uncharacterized protein YceK
MKAQLLAIIAAAGLSGATTMLSATEIDIGQPMLCAATQIVACDSQGGCVRGQPGEFNLPVFFLVDTENRVVMSARKGGERRSSAITSMNLEGDDILLAGFEVTGGGGWNALIEKSTGDMTVSAAGQGSAFFVFGACLSP